MNGQVMELAEALARADVGAAFGVPGSGLSWQLITALEMQGVPFTGTRHEAAAALMAGAYGRQSGRLGCSITIKGPGFANALPGILANAYEQRPAISVAEAYGPSAPPGRMHKRLDHRALAAPVTKSYAWLGDVPATVEEAVRTARAERPGPVHIDLVTDAQGQVAAREPANGSTDPFLASRALATIANARRPVVIVGSLATRAAWGRRLSGLRVPVLTTFAAKGVCDERLPQAAGVYTGDGKAKAPETVLLAEADLVVGLGLRNLEVLTPKPLAAPLVLLESAGPETAEGFGADVLVPWANESLFDEALDLLAEREWGCDVTAGLTRDVRESLLADEWMPARVFDTLERMLPVERRLALDTGAFCTVAEHLWRAASPCEVIASANGRYMGTALPMVLGAATAQPKVPHVCAIGDGGMMYAAEMKLASERGLPVLLLLLTDGRYGSIAGAPSAPRLSMSAVTMANPSWYRVARAMGWRAERVEGIDALERAVGSWLSEGGPMFVEAPFEPEAYARMTSSLR